ncbi:MAG: hypothetical protein AAGA88_08090 [Pseudomonadota bacterium]
MSVSSLTGSAGYVGLLTDLRDQLVERQRQLGTGERSLTYGGLESGRTLSLATNARRTEIEAFQATIQFAEVRLNLTDTVIGGIEDSFGEARGAILSDQFVTDGGTKTRAQDQADIMLRDMLGMLNTEADGRYIFSGRSVDVRPVEDPELILNGDAGRAGVKTIVNERTEADRGPLGQGRITTTPTATALTVAEDGTHPFGFKLTAITSTIGGAVTAGPSGTPPNVSLNLGLNQPIAGETVQIGLELPDGTTRDIVLTATDANPPGANEFFVGATVAGAIGNIEAAVQTALQDVAATELSAASAIRASQDFFAGNTANPPQRIVGPPFATATATTAGTPANTVIWFQGEPTGDPREAAQATVDNGLTVNYGTKANEEAFTWALSHLAAFATADFNETLDVDKDRFQALKSRTATALAYPDGIETIARVRSVVAMAGITMDRTSDRQRDDLLFLDTVRESVEGIDINQVSAEILTLQTRLEASYQTTARIANLSLVNFL